ncbi:uncharacterized protein BDR25DRAFT_347104 [Lindgomyces ingoldianus]|uniref:Uncharacterized protein n=1 Tax=Lindgomyces ingoldianus TaxID=673940 RepID=A0ACB6Q9M8_9PLEO|nr:uncharacterized protein BDR25DRAFT_347104 [Lindgomyces ingoldianus]KAF2463607.1 hypothetical protein BDR25DRAFT_347104 [Lindgomyces ingoldianus]
MVIPNPNMKLSSNDTRILHALFDPETLPSSVARSKDQWIVDASLPPHSTISSSQLSVLEIQQNNLIRRVTSTSKPRDGVIDDVLETMDKIATKWPNYPSTYLNRAMLIRIKLESSVPKDASIFSAIDPNIERLFTDLFHAIRLSSPPSLSTPISPYQARILRQAYSHRAYLYLKAAESSHDLKGKSKAELEELASLDFKNAARFGDEVAREMSVRTNPYAKMCGAIVRNALREERECVCN